MSNPRNLTKINVFSQGPPGEQGTRGEAGAKGDKVRGHENTRSTQYIIHKIKSDKYHTL